MNLILQHNGINYLFFNILNQIKHIITRLFDYYYF